MGFKIYRLLDGKRIVVHYLSKGLAKRKAKENGYKLEKLEVESEDLNVCGNRKSY